ncbi:MAG TPA: hypothetical protein EYH34_14695 [Planctomycetes bacterium]|nr:hypothetical protein [Anaerolineae bacterium]HIQ22469.1 hypothetical protein [Planctomycetota bacterium]
MRWWDQDCFDEFDVADPLQDQRMVPVDDDEAERLEQLCLAGTPGPLVIDDRSDGDGVVVATLPDGRMIVSRHVAVRSQEESEAAIQADAELICRARCMVLRMVRDRRLWRKREQHLLERIDQLEKQLEQARTAVDQMVTASQPLRPRQPR